MRLHRSDVPVGYFHFVSVNILPALVSFILFCAFLFQCPFPALNLSKHKTCVIQKTYNGRRRNDHDQKKTRTVKRLTTQQMTRVIV